MTKGLKDLEKRLRDEPDNLGLRVMVAGAMREAGRVGEAVELYRSVAIEYRDQGRVQQAIAVCRSILSIAPDDALCRELVDALEAPAAGPPPEIPRQPAPKPPLSYEPVIPRRAEVLITRISLGTPRRDAFPIPLPYHIADPTASIPKVSLADASSRASSESDTNPGESPVPARGSQSLVGSTSSGDLDLSAELETRQRPRISTADIPKLEPITDVVARLEPDDVDFDDPPPLPPIRASRPSANLVDGIPVETDTEDELTQPRDVPFDPEPILLRPKSVDPIATSFFSHLPIERRAAALSRFHRRDVKSGDVVIAKDAVGHPFVLVLRGELEARPDWLEPHPVGVGEYIGESSMLARAPSSATIVALMDSQILLLLPGDFYEIVGGFPALWSELKATAERRAKKS